MDDVRTVHLVAKTHLDVGFTALAADVVTTYVDTYIPAALALAAELRARGGPERFVWTTGSWLVHTFLERTDAAGRRAAEEAIASGDLAWHALPFTTHTELADVGLIEAGLEISARLDHRFGRRTIAAKLTDVPGHTRGLVPLLAAAGVELLHIGVNPVATVPDVPPAFRWRSPDGAEVTVVYQAGGYGDLTVVPGSADALAFAHTGDNLGPPSAEDVVASFAALRDRVPGADVRGSTLDAFAAALRPATAGLPVVTAEIGDTWIHGVGSDPVKVGRYRELLRLRRSWLDAGMVAPDDSRLRGFHENLLLVAEHTWGMDEKTHLPDRERWADPGFAALRAEPRAAAYEASWDEQRAYVGAAVAAIESDALRRSATSTLRVFDATSTGWAAVHELRSLPARLRLGQWEVGLDRRSGALTHLVDTESGVVLADADHRLGAVALQTFDEEDYERYWDAYVHARPEDEGWAREDNTKPGIDAAGATSSWREASEARIWEATVGRGRGLVDPWAPVVDDGRAVPVAALIGTQGLRDGSTVWSPWLTTTLRDATLADGPATLAFEVGWEAVTPRRLPHALWVGFRPRVDDPDAMVLDKLGQDVSPHDVVPGGGRHLHAVGEGVRWPSPAGGELVLRTLDAPLVAPGRPRLLDPSPEPLDLDAGVHVCLYDNVWGTNFPMWQTRPARFRFALAWHPA